METAITNSHPTTQLKMGDEIRPKGSFDKVVIYSCTLWKEAAPAWLWKDGVPAWNAEWIAIVWEKYGSHPFRVCFIYDRPEGWVFGYGRHFQTSTDAREMYRRWGGKG